MPLLVKNGVLFIATKVKGVCNMTRALSFENLTLRDDDEPVNYAKERIQDLLLDLKLNPDINKQIFVDGLQNVLLKKHNLIYRIGEIENKTYYGFTYDALIRFHHHAVTSYTITGKTNTPNVGINIEIQIYGNTNAIVEHIMAQNSVKIKG